MRLPLSLGDLTPLQSSNHQLCSEDSSQASISSQVHLSGTVRCHSYNPRTLSLTSALGKILTTFLFLLLLPTTFLEAHGEAWRKTSTLCFHPLQPTTWSCQPFWTHRLDSCHPVVSVSSIPWL